MTRLNENIDFIGALNYFYENPDYDRNDPYNPFDLDELVDMLRKCDLNECYFSDSMAKMITMMKVRYGLVSPCKCGNNEACYKCRPELPKKYRIPLKDLTESKHKNVRDMANRVTQLSKVFRDFKFEMLQIEYDMLTDKQKNVIFKQFKQIAKEH